MNNQNPATPAQAATPGNGEQVPPNASAVPTTPPIGGQGGQQSEEGTVSISTREFAQLNRDAARWRSFDKRKGFSESRNNNFPNQASGGIPPSSDPDVNAHLQRVQSERDQFAREATELKVKDGVRAILAKPEFANLPESTKNLILVNPSSLSKADNVEEALLDIEDFVRENTPLHSSQNQSGQGAASRPNPTGHESPPVISAGSPAPVNGEGLEDTSKLTGVARSRATLRNIMKKARGTK